MANRAINVAGKSVPPEQLRFDFTNPRLTDEVGRMPNTEDEMIDFFQKTADLDELLHSIAENGYLPFDDIVAVETEPNVYRVLEGNRRLAAIRLYRQRAIAERLKIELPAILPEKLATLNQIPIKVVASETDARAYIGFKHINGPHKWDALSKAKYAMRWISQGGSVPEIARAFGDTHNTVARQLNGLYVLEQAKRAGFRVEDNYNSRFAFSHLYTALSQAGFRDYLGLADKSVETVLGPDPVAAQNLEALSRVMKWLYGSQSEKLLPVIRKQNPDLGRLNRVLGKAQARNILETKGDLDRAYDAVEPRSKRFVAALIQANDYAEGALGLVSDYDGSDESIKDTSSSLVRTSRTIEQVVKKRIDERNEDKERKRKEGR
jgi:DNA-binding CsgD family transcriptional regulator